jgi:L-ascorbate metabolism protein UlaG (beta-lactamase superfamily)
VISHLQIDYLSYGSLDMIEPRMGWRIVPWGGPVSTPNYRCRIDELPRWRTLEDRGLRVAAVPVSHPGWRYGLDDARMEKSGNAHPFEYHGITAYFGGDRGYDSTMFVETGRRFLSIDLAFIPIAPIHPGEYSGGLHADPADALRILIAVP